MTIFNPIQQFVDEVMLMDDKGKRQLRAEAVGRLNAIWPADSADEVVRAAIGSDEHPATQSIMLADLLTDENADEVKPDGKIYVNPEKTGVSNKEFTPKADDDAPATDANAPITDNVRECPLTDPVEMLRKAADGYKVGYDPADYLATIVGDTTGAGPLTTIDLLHALADMVERGYVRREGYDTAAKMCRFYADRTARLEAERDYWRSQVGRCLERAWPDHAPGVMGYPDRDGCAEPSALVIKAIDQEATLLAGAREERDAWMRRYEEVVSSRNEVVSSRNGGPAPESGAAAGQVDSDGGDADTREKLEADVRGYILCTPLSTVDYDDGMMLVEKMAEWLDRQAAITEREVAG